MAVCVQHTSGVGTQQLLSVPVTARASRGLELEGALFNTSWPLSKVTGATGQREASKVFSKLAARAVAVNRLVGSDGSELNNDHPPLLALTQCVKPAHQKAKDAGASVPCVQLSPSRTFESLQRIFETPLPPRARPTTGHGTELAHIISDQQTQKSALTLRSLTQRHQACSSYTWLLIRNVSPDQRSFVIKPAPDRQQAIPREQQVPRNSEPVFRLSRTKGTLGPGEVAAVSVDFTPSAPQPFSQLWQVHWSSIQGTALEDDAQKDKQAALPSPETSTALQSEAFDDIVGEWVDEDQPYIVSTRVLLHGAGFAPTLDSSALPAAVNFGRVTIGSLVRGWARRQAPC